MKKFFIVIVFLLPLFFNACKKRPGVIPGPDPGPSSYKSTILVTFNIPEGVDLGIGNDMWVLDSNKEQLTNRIQTSQPTTSIILTGDTVKNNLAKKVYLYFDGTRIIERTRYGYTVRKSFILKKNVSLTFDVPAERKNIEILDP